MSVLKEVSNHTNEQRDCVHQTPREVCGPLRGWSFEKNQRKELTTEVSYPKRALTTMYFLLKERVK